MRKEVSNPTSSFQAASLLPRSKQGSSCERQRTRPIYNLCVATHDLRGKVCYCAELEARKRKHLPSHCNKCRRQPCCRRDAHAIRAFARLGCTIDEITAAIRFLLPAELRAVHNRITSEPAKRRLSSTSKEPGDWRHVSTLERRKPEAACREKLV